MEAQQKTSTKLLCGVYHGLGVLFVVSFSCVHVVVYVSSRESVEGRTPIFGCSQPDHSTLSFCCNPCSVGDPIFC